MVKRLVLFIAFTAAAWYGRAHFESLADNCQRTVAGLPPPGTRTPEPSPDGQREVRTELPRNPFEPEPTATVSQGKEGNLRRKEPEMRAKQAEGEGYELLAQVCMVAGFGIPVLAAVVVFPGRAKIAQGGA